MNQFNKFFVNIYAGNDEWWDSVSAWFQRGVKLDDKYQNFKIFMAFGSNSRPKLFILFSSKKIGLKRIFGFIIKDWHSYDWILINN